MAEEEPVAEGEFPEGEAGEAGEEVATGGQDLYYVPEKALDAIKEQLSSGKGEDEIKPFLEQMTNPGEIEDEEMMLPVDMRGVGQDFASVEEMLEQLGVQGAAEAFVKAREYFEANHDGEDEESRPKPMSAGEWKLCLAGSMGGEEGYGEGHEEEPVFEGAEEEVAEAWGEGAEEEAQEGAEGAEGAEGEWAEGEHAEGEGEGEGGEGEGEGGEGEGEDEGEPDAKKARTEE